MSAKAPALLLAAFLSLTAFYPLLVKSNGSWVWVRDTTTGNYGEAVIGTGTSLYFARGTSFYRYSPADNTWLAMADPPKPDGEAFKTGATLAWDFGNYIYALYGAATSDSRRWFYRYSTSGNSWQQLANTTADQGEGDTLAWVDNEGYVYATIGGEQRATYLVRYSSSTNSWSNTPADPPEGMGDGASLVWTGGDYLYALRGEFLEDSPLYDFWRYSLAGNSWTAMTSIPASVHDGGVGGVGDGGSLLYVGHWMPSQTGYIYALSGNQAYPESPAIPDNRTYRYTISTNIWERLPDLPFGVGYYVGNRLAYANGSIYAWQGAPSTWANGGDDLVKYGLPSELLPPQAVFTYYPVDCYVNMTVNFDASSSTAEGYNVSIVMYEWDFGDETPKVLTTHPLIAHIFAIADSYIVTLNVTDSQELWSIRSEIVTVLPPTGPVADFGWDPSTPIVSHSILFDASISKLGWNGTGYSPIVNYRWDFGDGNITIGYYLKTVHTYIFEGNYTVKLNITDTNGLTGYTARTVTVRPSWISGDINCDLIVDKFDAILLANAYYSVPGDEHWNPNADLNGTNNVDIYDAIILAGNYGKTA